MASMFPVNNHDPLLCTSNGGTNPPTTVNVGIQYNAQHVSAACTSRTTRERWTMGLMTNGISSSNTKKITTNFMDYVAMLSVIAAPCKYEYKISIPINGMSVTRNIPTNMVAP